MIVIVQPQKYLSLIRNVKGFSLKERTGSIIIKEIAPTHSTYNAFVCYGLLRQQDRTTSFHSHQQPGSWISGPSFANSKPEF